MDFIYRKITEIIVDYYAIIEIRRSEILISSRNFKLTINNKKEIIKNFKFF